MIDRRSVGERAKLLPHGRSHTKPGSLLKSQISIRTWAQWDDAVLGFVEIDLVGHEGVQQLRPVLLHPDRRGHRLSMDSEHVRAEAQKHLATWD